MSRFFVGQRVRVVRPNYPQNMGLTGTITGMFAERPSDLCGAAINCYCDWDDRPFSPAGARMAAHTRQLEPIYDGNEVVSWESMRDVWQPAEQGQPA